MAPTEPEAADEPTAAERAESPVVEVRVFQNGRLVHVGRCESEDEAAGVAGQWEDLEGVEVLIEDLSARHQGDEILEPEPPEAGIEEHAPQPEPQRWRR